MITLDSLSCDGIYHMQNWHFMQVKKGPITIMFIALADRSICDVMMNGIVFVAFKKDIDSPLNYP